MAKYLLDTNILIYLINEKPQSIAQKIMKCKLNELTTSSIVVSELLFGIEKSKHKENNLKALKKVLSFLTIYDFGYNEAKAYAIIRADLEQRRQLIGAMDMLIAATAMANKLVLVTNNQKEFDRIMGLSVENWAK